MSATHIVKKGDNLSKIAQSHGVTLAELLKANPQFSQNGRSPNTIFPGENVNIPAAAFGGGVAAKSCAQCSLGDSPPYEPNVWNTAPIQKSTNCYAYAVDDPNGHPLGGKPQPGVKCGHPWKTVSCKDVTAASKCDGLIPAPNPPAPKAGYYPVALVSAPGVDYHWYRLDNNGTWSHKPGHGTARNVDSSGKIITNPETADRSGYPNYSDFCGYFYVPKGGASSKP